MPPRVKALTWRVPVEEIMLVPPPLKVRPPPEVVIKMLSKSAWVARRPFDISKEPAKDEEPVPENTPVPPEVKLPEMLEAPPTSNLVSTVPPELIPTLPESLILNRSRPSVENAN